MVAQMDASAIIFELGVIRLDYVPEGWRELLAMSAGLTSCGKFKAMERICFFLFLLLECIARGDISMHVAWRRGVAQDLAFGGGRTEYSSLYTCAVLDLHEENGVDFTSFFVSAMKLHHSFEVEGSLQPAYGRAVKEAHVATR